MSVQAVDLSDTGSGYPDMNALLAQIKDLSAKTYIINATEEAQKMGNPILANMILIGALTRTGLLPINEAELDNVIKQMFPKAVEINQKALNRGMELVG